MREYELGQLLVNDLLPEDMRDYNRVISKGSMGKLMTELAKKHPEQYKEISHKLLQLGYQAAYLTNGDSFTLKDMSPTAISKKMQKELNKEVQDILAKARSKGIKTNDPKVNKAIIDACIKWSKKSDEGTTEESNFDTNALYRQAQKTGVGAQKPGTYKSIRTGDVLYVDQNNKPVPIPVTHSYAQGLRPAEYFAGAFGTRKGIVDLQKATQQAGFLCCAETELVMMADFTSKAIKDIKVGDYVLGIEDDLNNPKYKPVKVLNVFNNGLRDCYKTVFDKDVEFVSTLDHKILCNAGKVNNEVLPVGSKGIKAITINNEALSIKEQIEVGKLNTYDLEVDSPNHLFVLASGLIVHNSKQLVQIAHRLVVDSNDSDQPYDEKNPIGYPSTVDDPDNEGAMLSMPVAGYKRNTVLTPKILADMKQKGVKNILVRSVIAGGPANGGIYAYDAGIRETGSLPAQGDFVGIKSVQAISEPITQSAISCLHPNTEVRMGDGTVKLLKDIKVGDIVLGADKQGYTAPVKVVNVFNNGIQPVYETKYGDINRKYTIKATKKHKILQLIQGNIVEQEIGNGNNPIILSRKDDTVSSYYKISQKFLGNVETLDIEVDNEDHLFVLANGMVVSNSKHSGGVAGAESGKAISGFKYINQLIQVPKHFPGGATHATVDGKVERIRPAAQGGYYITVAGHDHYVRTDKGDETPILVKVGDEVEAGDVMSDGIPNPAMIVKYKGLGEGRRYFTNMFRDALDRAGTPVNRRNIETLSRGLISYVKLNSEIGDYSPDDILPYSMVAADYQPRDGYVAKEPKSCKGMYLEKPVLHYTIGTRITPKVIKELNDFGIKQVTCHKDPPPFESEMVRGMAHAASDPDWGTKMLGSYNKESLLESARLGAVSNTQGTSYVPALAFGDPTFGNTGATKQGAYELLKAAADAASLDAVAKVNATTDLYDKLSKRVGTHVASSVVPSDVPARSNMYWDASANAPGVKLDPNASVYTLLHEKGHINDYNSGRDMGGGIRGANANAWKLFGNYKWYKPEDLRDILNGERLATRYALDTVGRIEDKDVRDKAVQQARAELIPAIQAYDLEYGTILNGHKTGKTIGNYTGAALGATAGGVGGYYGANWLSKKLGLQGKDVSTKRKIADILLRTSGTLGGAALGGYGGYNLGGSIGGAAGQVYAQYKQTKPEYDQQIKNLANQIYSAHNQDTSFLSDYLNKNQ